MVGNVGQGVELLCGSQNRMAVSSINVHVLWSVNTCTTHVPG